jgi:hypothetical protein
LTAFFDNREIASTLGKVAFTAEGNMSGAKITPAFQDYDHTLALVDGAVTVEGYDLKTTTISPPSRIFLRMLNKEEFDASEMSLSNYMIALEHGDRRFVGDSGFSVPGVSAFLYLDQHQRRYPGAERSHRQTGRHCGLLDDGIAFRSRYAQARV